MLRHVLDRRDASRQAEGQRAPPCATDASAPPISSGLLCESMEVPADVPCPVARASVQEAHDTAPETSCAPRHSDATSSVDQIRQH